MEQAPTKERARAAEDLPDQPVPTIYHIVTGHGTLKEGGMSAHMSLLAGGLAEGGEVHVWQPPETDLGECHPGVKIHKTLDRISFRGFRRTGRALRSFPKPRRLLVYWVPHAYGYKSMNVPFCLWMWWRSAWHKDRVELLVQECFLRFNVRGWRQDAAALVHRLMTMILLRCADHVWIALTCYEDMLRPFALGRPVTFEWLPVPSNVDVLDDPAAVARIRKQLAPSGFLLGHFGTFGAGIADLLESLVPPVLRGLEASLLLLGSGGIEFRERLVRQYPDLAERIHATGYMTEAALSSYLSACDVMIQPYPDGVTARRGSTLAPLAHGRPIVTNVAGPTEPFWKETGAVVLTELAPQAFLEAIRRLKNDSGARESVAAAASQTYQRYFKPSHMVETIVQRD